MWTIHDAPSDRDYAEQQSPYGPEGEDPDNALPTNEDKDWLEHDEDDDLPSRRCGVEDDEDDEDDAF